MASPPKSIVTLKDCDKVIDKGDGRSQWELMPDNQIRLRGQESQCLSLLGTGPPPEVDVAQGQYASATSSYDQVAHGPARAVDGKLSTYWASKAIEDGEAVKLEVDFGMPVKVNSVDVDWEYPPNSFALQLSQDGQRWVSVYEVDTNPHHSSKSHIPLTGQWSTGARLVMYEPDAQEGIYDGQAHYGVRAFKVNSPSLIPTLEECGLAKQSRDARDKWFLSHVSQFDPCERRSHADEKRRQRYNAPVFVDQTWVGSRASGRRRAAGSFLWADTDNDEALNAGYSRQELRALTQWRQSHRRTVDGHLCAAASVQNRQAFTGCTTMPTPDGDSGQEWCYLEPQLLPGLPPGKAWGYCAPTVDYDEVRAHAPAQPGFCNS